MNDASELRFNAALTDYLREVVCKCPRCGGRAVIRADARYAIPWMPTDVSFVCASCVYRHGWPASNWTSDFPGFDPADGREPYFGYELWAVGQIGIRTLAILNEQHADDLAECVARTDRPRPKNSKWSAVNRLPKWVLLAKNRQRVLALIVELRSSLR